MGILIRPATPNDLDWILSSLRDLDGFWSPSKVFYHDDEHARQGLLDMIGNHFFRIAEKDGLPIGLVAGFVVPHTLNPEKRTLVETFWWVHPLAQGRARAGLALMDEFTAWGREHCSLTIFSLTAASPVGAHALMRRGYELKQFDFYLESEVA